MSHIALFFGTFDPLHRGHLSIAQEALRQGSFDAVWLVLSELSPFKLDQRPTAFADRAAMIELGVQALPGIELCPIEHSLPSPSYTIETLSALGVRYPQHRFSLLMGSDNFEHLESWKSGSTILASYPIWVYRRGGATGVQTPLPDPHYFDAPLLDISSTQIRAVLRSGGSLEASLTEEVEAYIRAKGLYGLSEN